MSPSEPNKSERALWVAGAALLVGTVALLVAVALVATEALREDDGRQLASGASDASPALVDGDPVIDPDAVPECRLLATSAVLRPSGAIAAGLEAGQIKLTPVAPAREGAGGAINFTVRDTINLPCDASAGVVSLRGGVQLTREDSRVDLRRLRVDLAAQSVRMFLAPSGSPGFEGTAWRQKKPTLTKTAAGGTLRLPMELTETGAIALSAGLQDPILFSGGERFAELTLRLEPAPGSEDDPPDSADGP